jgi:lysophospholipase L1-like esterase
MLSIETGLHVVKFVLDRVHGVDLDRRLRLSFYRDEKWAVPMFVEYHKTRMVFDQFLGWKTEEYHGKYINVDEKGMRSTLNFQQMRVPADSVFLFGGSLIWGAYVRDEKTIPSHLSKLLNERGKAAVVINCAERGYTFTQGVFRLLLLLKAGHRPGIVIFCDGLNDIAAALTNGRAGIISLHSELKNAIEIKWLPYQKQLALLLTDILHEESMIYKSLDRLITMLLNDGTVNKYKREALDSLSAGIVAEYASAHSVLDSLSQIYGFTYACFLQPIMYTKEFVTDEEFASDPQAADSSKREFYLSVYDSLEKSGLPHLFMLSHVFDGKRASYYSDICHISEDGNQLVANEIVRLAFTRWGTN